MGSTTLIDLKARRGGSSAPTPPDDDHVELYERRKQIYPQLISGRFRTIKWGLLIATLAVYYLLPFLRWDRGPDASDQAVLADFAGGRFYFFGLEIWPQEVFYITGLLILAAVGLFLATALFGRVWCGYFCPQTVWTDLFLVVERFFEGDRNARMKRDKAPLTLDKAWRKGAKHAAWLLVSFLTGGAFILYWHDARELAQTFFSGHAPMTAYVFAGLLTATTYALAGTMREQVCTYMCPWPRIQAALVDKHTLAVTYRSDRGEPRAPHKKGETWEGRGDCIDCKQCVVVCPMGIDIRNGSQLECINCSLCIDACNAVMKKVGRPAGLIAYDTDDNVIRRAAKQRALPFQPLRSRTVLYAGVFALTGGIMALGLLTRSDLDVSVSKDRALPFVQLASGDVRNAYTLKVANKQRASRDLALKIEGISGAQVEIVGEGSAAAPGHITPAPDGVDRYRILVTAPQSSIAGTSSPISIVLYDGGRQAASTTTQFQGPEH